MRFAPIALVLLLAGCAMPDVEPVHEIKDRESVVVMPFKDPDFPDRWASPRGHDLAARTTQALLQRCDFKTREYEQVLELAQGGDARRLGPGEVAARTHSDYVLVCDVVQFDLRDPLSINIQQGTSRVRVRLYQTDTHRGSDARERERDRAQDEARERAGLPPLVDDTGVRFIREDEVVAKFPTDFHEQYGEIFLRPEDIQAGLIVATANKVAQLYYEHPQDHTSAE
jgi:hypothetical protein